MAEQKFPREFKTCPSCDWPETIGQIAFGEMVEAGKLKEGFYSLRKTIVPLINPQTAKLTLPILLLHYDICGRCGQEYCIKAERQDAPVQMIRQAGPGGAAGFPPQGPWPAR